MRFGLFGTGPWAHLAHAPALAAHPDVEFVGVWGRNPARRRRWPASTARKPYAEIDELIADVDAIAIALPPDVQAPIALRAARAGKHLLLDKPVAFTTEPRPTRSSPRSPSATSPRWCSSPAASCRRSSEFIAEAGGRRLAGGPGRPPRLDLHPATRSGRRPGARRAAACGTSARTRSR
jgi:hypothetical protein